MSLRLVLQLCPLPCLLDGPARDTPDLSLVLSLALPPAAPDWSTGMDPGLDSHHCLVWDCPQIPELPTEFTYSKIVLWTTRTASQVSATLSSCCSLTTSSYRKTARWEKCLYWAASDQESKLWRHFHYTLIHMLAHMSQEEINNNAIHMLFFSLKNNTINCILSPRRDATNFIEHLHLMQRTR